MTTFHQAVREAYAIERDEQAWLEGIVRALGGALGTEALAAVIHPRETGPRRMGRISAPPAWSPVVEQVVRTTVEADFELMRAAYEGGPFVERLSERANRHAPDVRAQLVDEQLTRQLAPSSGDLLGIYGGSLAGGCMVCVADGGPLAPRTRWALRRVAAHIAAAFRLRKSVGQEFDAILDDDGRVLERRVALEGMEEALAEAAVQSRRAETTDSESALDLWRGLVAGRWTIVHVQDRRGRRQMLLRRNEIDEAVGEDARGRRVSSVLGLAARGHSNKYIAYELGLPISTVAADLKRGLDALGLRSRLDLTQLRSFAEAAQVAARAG